MAHQTIDLAFIEELWQLITAKTDIGKGFVGHG
jgi:hypothetical protein